MKLTLRSALRHAEAMLFHDDGQTRVTRWSLVAGADMIAEHIHEYEYIVIPITGGSLIAIDADGVRHPLVQYAGQPYLGFAGTHHTVVNESDKLVIFVEVELIRYLPACNI